MTFWENLTALVNSYSSSENNGELSRPGMVGLLFGSRSRQLEIRSRMRPSSFFLARTPALAKAYMALSRASWFVICRPGYLGASVGSSGDIPFSRIYSATFLKWNFFEFSCVYRLL